MRLRRSCLAVPGSSPKMLDKARSLPADQVFLDLEDAVAPSEKTDATRQNIVDALRRGLAAKTKVVRINGVATRWCWRDVTYVVEGAGAHLDCIMIPKVHDASHVHFVDHLLTQLELDLGLEVGRIGLELQIETGHGARQDGRDRVGLAARRDADLRPRRLRRQPRHPAADGRRDRDATTRATSGTTSTPGS